MNQADQRISGQNSKSPATPLRHVSNLDMAATRTETVARRGEAGGRGKAEKVAGGRPEPRPSIAELAAQWDDAQGVAADKGEQLDRAGLAAAALYPAEPWARPGGPWAQSIAEKELRCRQIEAIDVSFDVPRLEAAYTLALRRAERLAAAICATPAVTVADAAIKFRVLVEQFGESWGRIGEPHPLRGFLADLEALAAADQARPGA